MAEEKIHHELRAALALCSRNLDKPFKKWSVEDQETLRARLLGVKEAPIPRDGRKLAADLKEELDTFWLRIQWPEEIGNAFFAASGRLNEITHLPIGGFFD